MNNIEVKKTYPSDFERIYPLLQAFDSPYSKEQWKKIFTYSWDGAENYVGFHLEDKNNIVGFMGLIFSCRNISNEPYKYCNITSLIVKQNYRSATLFLLRKLKGLDGTILTGLRPINESYRMLTLMGFSAFENHYKIIPTILSMLHRKGQATFYQFPDLLNIANEENRRISIDHSNLNCKLVLVENKNNQCLIVYKLINQLYFKVTFQKIHILFMSDVNVFNENTYEILRYFGQKYGVLSAIYADKRYVKNHKVFSIERVIVPPRISHNPYSGKIDIDELYSEGVLL